MTSWVKAIESKDLQEDQLYFLGKRYTPEGMVGHFYSKCLNGKLQWSVKPGIALRFKGDDNFKEVLAKNPSCVAVLVPKDADTRWKARKKRFSY